MSSHYDVDPKKGFIAWWANNSVAANLLMALIIITGLFMVGQVRKQMFPEIELNIISVQVPFPGAAPQEVEQGVLVRIEDAIEDVNGIERVTSTAREGSGSVSIEVESGYDVQVVMDEVKMLIDAIPSFPQQIEKPNIYRIRPQRQVIWMSIYGAMDEYSQKELAKSIRDELKDIGGITKVEVVGARDYEISIEISEADLQRYNLTFQDVVQAVRGTSIDVAGGSIRTPNGDILLRANNQAYVGDEFERITLINRPDGTRLTLGDIATVNDAFIESRRFTQFDGGPATFIRVDSVGNQNDLKIAEVVRNYAERKQKELPPDVNIAHWGDASYYLQDRLDLMIGNMISGGFLVFIMLSLFLQLHLAFWVMIGIPLCFLGTIALMPLPMFDISINMISLFGFILVLGIVVDDAIVIGESAYSEIEANGKSIDNVVVGAKKVAMPATFGVLTTMVAFIPMLMVEGGMGAIWESIAWVVILCLAFSLVESKLILPAHIAHMKFSKTATDKQNGFQRVRNKISNGLKVFVDKYYRPFLAKCLHYRYTTLASFIAMFILAIGLISGGVVRWVFFPNIPGDFIQAQVQMQPGSSEEATISALQQVEQALRAVDARAEDEGGMALVKHVNTWMSGTTGGTVMTELVKGDDINIDGFKFINDWRQQVPEIAGVKSLNFQGSVGGGGGFDVEFQLTGENLQDLSAAATLLKQELGQFDGVFDIEDTFGEGNDEIILELKPLATAMGISLQELAGQVRYAFYGAEAQRIQRGDEEVRVMVRYPLDERQSVGNLEDMKLRTADGSLVPFTELANVRFAKGYNTITRINRERSVNVRARVDKDRVEPFQIVRQVMAEKLPPILDQYPSVGYKLEGASQDEAEATNSLAIGFALALFAIYALMAIPLRSYSQPMIIMSVIPFGMVGAVVGHWVIGMPISILSLFGIIALAGVVVNDSLVMVDYVNRARADGVELRKAVAEAGAARFRAIILTSLTTFFGLLPIVLETSMQAKLVIPMAISLAFGILFATVITLLLIPCLYLILDDTKRNMRTMLSWYGLAKPPAPKSAQHNSVT
ncbi:MULTISPECIES: efflux RND transporter permease subunit [Idiomarina]|uniref:efflux RND transporter permease subunit n=1 Tax=Idiomarina TaxID=135575 RepID=UPI00129CF753|nr:MULTISPECIES: efflux RND transporter permease subunit [Idiomarina]MRJ42721.1 acriflavin resistance protein [Idiomarina sp. FeN1]NCU58285.1 acriflavin resistance protein [Idiomarina sp. FenA--70]NCU60983.1 acriflavin resistance protein [Idiomarina sp. FenBw--71]UUN14131.1 efflux RND transporter permease subunit [Idiomarina loihiensis]